MSSFVFKRLLLHVIWGSDKPSLAKYGGSCKKLDFKKDMNINFMHQPTLYNRNKKGELDINIKSIVYNIELLTELNWDKVFKHIELSSDVPVVMFKKNLRDTPEVKLYKGARNQNLKEQKQILEKEK